jgi:7,8-dihydroneopterin aldolase/epimerase/oxygenase
VVHFTKKSAMDTIQLTGIRGYGYTGYLPEEQTLGQWFEVDATLWVDLSQAGKSDNIADTVDYRQTIAIVQDTIRNAKFALVEKLADAIVTSILEKQSLVNQVKIKLTKLAPPIPDFGGQITIEIIRGNG